MNPSLLTPDILNGLMGPQSQNQQVGPSNAPPPQAPQTQPPNYNIEDIFKAQQDSNTKIADYVQNITRAMEPSQRELELQKVSAYTPEKRAKDIYNKMFGITEEPLYDPTNKNPDQSPIETKSHTNWKKAVPAWFGELFRAYGQGKNYQAPQDRAREIALQQYQAEISPLKTELGTEAANKRAMLGDSIKALQAEISNNHWLGSNMIQRQKADQQQQLNAITIALGPDKAAKLKAEVERLHSQNDVAGVEKILKQAQADLVTKTMGLKDTPDSAKEANKLKVAELMAGIRSKQITEINGVPVITDKRTGQSENVRAPGESVSNGQNTGQTGTLPVGQTPPGIPPPPIAVPGVNAPAIGDMSKLKGNMPGVPPKIPVTWQTPEEKYGTGRALYPVTQKFPDTPPGHSPVNDAVLNDVTSHFSADQKKVVRTALDLYSKGNEFVKGLDSIPDSAFGSVSGNLNKWLSGKIDESSFGGNPETQAKLQYLRGLAETIAVSHLGAQTIRSGEMAKRIADEINSWGTTKSSILANLKGYIDQSGETLRHTPGSKTIAAPELGSYFEVMRLYHPELYDKYKQGVSDELKRRQKK